MNINQGFEACHTLEAETALGAGGSIPIQNLWDDLTGVSTLKTK